jgi:hypothetical protein
MITVRIRQRRADGGQTVWKVTAPTIRKALAAVSGDVVFPLQPEEFFAGAKVSATKTENSTGRGPTACLWARSTPRTPR